MNATIVTNPIFSFKREQEMLNGNMKNNVQWNIVLNCSDLYPHSHSERACNAMRCAGMQHRFMLHRVQLFAA